MRVRDDLISDDHISTTHSVFKAFHFYFLQSNSGRGNLFFMTTNHVMKLQISHPTSYVIKGKFLVDFLDTPSLENSKKNDIFAA